MCTYRIFTEEDDGPPPLEDIPLNDDQHYVVYHHIQSWWTSYSSDSVPGQITVTMFTEHTLHLDNDAQIVETLDSTIMDLNVANWEQLEHIMLLKGEGRLTDEIGYTFMHLECPMIDAWNYNEVGLQFFDKNDEYSWFLNSVDLRSDADDDAQTQDYDWYSYNYQDPECE
jgi:hypothetical protein